MLFSVLTMVMLSYHLVEEEPPEYEGVSERLSDLYRLRTVQCLALGDITKCAPYTMETLLFYEITEQARKSDSGTGVWLMHGTILRVAQQMGYHRQVDIKICSIYTNFSKGPIAIPRNLNPSRRDETPYMVLYRSLRLRTILSNRTTWYGTNRYL